MKNMNLLIWLTQLGLSVAVPLAGFVFLGIWLHNSCSWGQWTVWVGVILGVTTAADGLRQSLKAMERMSGGKEESEPPVSFNDHD
jgi:hypothetical protein